MDNIINRDVSIDKQVQKIIKDFGLDFKIIKIPLGGILFDSNGKLLDIAKYDKKGNIQEDVVKYAHLLKGRDLTTEYFGLYNSKTGKEVNTVKEGYGVSQNDEVIELVLRGMEKFGTQLKVTKAGSLNGGKKVYIQLEIEGEGKVGKDTITRYVTVIDSNDGSHGLSVGIGDLTWSCDNQFYKFYKKGQSKFRHTATIQEKMQEIPYLIELALKESLAQLKVYRKFQSTKVSYDLAHKLVHEVIGYDRAFTSLEKQALQTPKAKAHMDRLYEFMDAEIADKGLNLWGLHSGVTRWTTHGRTIKKRDNSLEESLMTGTSYPKAMTSFKWCVGQSGLLLKPKTEMMLENI